MLLRQTTCVFWNTVSNGSNTVLISWGVAGKLNPIETVQQWHLHCHWNQLLTQQRISAWLLLLRRQPEQSRLFQLFSRVKGIPISHHNPVSQKDHGEASGRAM